MYMYYVYILHNFVFAYVIAAVGFQAMALKIHTLPM